MLGFGISSLLYVFFGVAQFQFKQEASKKLKEGNHLQLMKIPANEFNSRDKQNEVWVKGCLYDISSCKIINDTAYVSVLHDENEEGLIKNIVESFETGNSYQQDNLHHLTRHRIHIPDTGKILSKGYTITSKLIQFTLIPGSEFKTEVVSVVSEILKPPPRIHLS